MQFPYSERKMGDCSRKDIFTGTYARGDGYDF